jgi:hypothetical protein
MLLVPMLLGMAACAGMIRAQTNSLLPHEDSRFGIFGAYAANEYTYFKNRMGFSNDEYWKWTDAHFRNLGAHWTRSNVQLLWDQIEPVLDGPYNWTNSVALTDAIITNMYKAGNEVHWLGVFHEGALFGNVPPNARNPLSDTSRYLRFVRAAVERYNGDGTNDVCPGVRVKYWQLGNEGIREATPHDRTNYVTWVAQTARVIREVDPAARIVLLATGDDIWRSNMLVSLSATCRFDVVDIHYWDNADNFRMSAVPQVRGLLDALGCTHVEIWSTEHGTWVGQPTQPKVLPLQSELDQARSLVKRYVYNLDKGLDKLFWNNLMEWNCLDGFTNGMFSSMGLVGDGQGGGGPTNGFNVVRLSYDTYRLLASAIDADKARYVGRMSFHSETNLFAYRFCLLADTNLSRYVMWSSTNTLQTVTFPVAAPGVGVVGLITDATGRPSTNVLVARDGAGNVTLSVGPDPVLVQDLEDAAACLDLDPGLAGDERTVRMRGGSGQPWMIQTTPALGEAWTPACTNWVTAPEWAMVDRTAAGASQRFYRAVAPP